MNNKIGLFFGSFNPIHIGHLIIANHVVEHSDLDQVWLVVSPQNPFKDKKSLAKDRDRFHLAKIAIGDNLKLDASDIEFGLPRPSYTINTLSYLHEKYPQKEFSLIMGSDNLENIDKWKNGDILLNKYHIYIYDRPGDEQPKHSDHPNVRIVNGPLLEISSTFIRQQLQAGKSIRYLVTDEVREYIENSRMYS